MSNCEFLGTLEEGPDGNVYLRRPVIPPAPRRKRRAVPLPPVVAQEIEAGRAVLADILGDSMEPGILHGDVAVLSAIRQPRSGDVVMVAARRPHPIFGKIAGTVWRYRLQRGRAYLTKDNAKYPGERPVTREEILGVVTQMIPRPCRDTTENYERVQRDLAMHRDLKWKVPEDLGFYHKLKLDQLRAVFTIPDSEVIRGRLPWGLFRASPIEDHPHAGLAIGDTLTIAPTIEGCVGDMLVERSNEGETIIGTLQREGLGTASPGEFYIDLPDRRIVTHGSGRSDDWRPIATIRRVERCGVVISYEVDAAALDAAAAPNDVPR